MGTNKGMSSGRARTQVETYVHRLLGSNRQASGWMGTSGTKLSLPKGRTTGSVAGSPHTLPRQVEATAYTKSSQKASSGSGSSFGNAWLISPVASTVKSILNLFGGGNSTAQSTRYRTSSRQTFRIVESISPEGGSGTRNLNESAAALTGVTSHTSTSEGVSPTALKSKAVSTTTLSGGTMSQFENRQALVASLRRSLSESRGITDVLNEFQDGL